MAVSSFGGSAGLYCLSYSVHPVHIWPHVMWRRLVHLRSHIALPCFAYYIYLYFWSCLLFCKELLSIKIWIWPQTRQSMTKPKCVISKGGKTFKTLSYQTRQIKISLQFLRWTFCCLAFRIYAPSGCSFFGAVAAVAIAVGPGRRWKPIGMTCNAC